MILLVEDEPQLAQVLKLLLKKMGFNVLHAETLQEARKILKTDEAIKITLWILDRNLPDGDGLDLLKDPGTKQERVLVLSSKSSAEDRIRGLKRGADDYLAKPFHAEELKLRIEALHRRGIAVNKAQPPIEQQADQQIDQQQIDQPIFTLRPDQLQVRCHSGWIDLTPLEYKFLSYMIARPNVIVSKDRLLKDVWGFSFLPKTRTVDYVITQLRKCIEPDPNQPKHLLTIRGAGVKWMG